MKTRRSWRKLYTSGRLLGNQASDLFDQQRDLHVHKLMLSQKGRVACDIESHDQINGKLTLRAISKLAREGHASVDHLSFSRHIEIASSMPLDVR